MASYKPFVISGFLLVTIIIVVQSIPIKQIKKIVKSSAINNKKDVNTEETSSISTSSPITTVSQNSLLTPEVIQENNDNKKKRYIDDDQLDEFLDSESDEMDTNQLPYSKFDNNHNRIHAKIQETSANIHDNADKPVDTDNSKIFSDIKMTPNELTDVIRRRRDVKLNDESNRRRKRALSPYDFYDTDSFYDPYAGLIEREQYVRPIRSFAPLYWYPSVYERNIRSALAPSVYDSSIIDDDDESDENPISILDDENDYESNRYPILLQSSNNPFDNLQLQQQYNTDDLPIDEDFEDNFNVDDDDDNEEQYGLLFQRERPYYIRYEPIDTYF
jgi:hypothetical protein